MNAARKPVKTGARAGSSSADLLPKCDLGWLGDNWAKPRQHGLHIRLLHVLLQVRLGDPVFVKQEERMVIQGLVEVLIQTPGVLAARGDEGQQFMPDLAFLARLRFDLRGDGERIGVHYSQISGRRMASGKGGFRSSEVAGLGGWRVSAGRLVECLL